MVSPQGEVVDQAATPRSASGPGEWLPPLVAALVLAGALLVLYLLAFHVSRVEQWDAKALRGFMTLQRPGVVSAAQTIADLAKPVPFAVIAVALAVIALVRRRPALVGVEALILLGANLSTEALKPLAGWHRTIVLGAGTSATDSFPSGHATAAMSLTLCAVIVMPRSIRPIVAAAGALFCFAIGYALVLLSAHFPSDVIGGYLMAGAWALLGLAALRALPAHRPSRAAARWAPAALDAFTPVGFAFAAMIVAIGISAAVGSPSLAASSVAIAAAATGVGAAFVAGLVATFTVT